MKCPYCFFEESKVIDSRPIDDGTKIRRRRQCIKCLKRFTTFEEIEKVPLTVVKKDGSMEFFNKEKLINGILRSCEKRPIKKLIVEDMVSRIETLLRSDISGEVKTSRIGELVMSELRKVDQVAYVRFASVYKEFQDIETFEKELIRMKNTKD